MKIQAPNLNSLWATLLVEELVRNQVRYFCLPPGSRCAPLTNAVAAHPDATVIGHFDERGAAFHALGYGKATGRPATLITTSGTAVANVYPAVVEASMDRVPLLVLTADRPPELQRTGANQAIDQPGFFAPYARWHIDLPCPTTDIDPGIVLTAVDQAVYRARRPPRGPVHVNLMFREPLAPTPEDLDTDRILSRVSAWREVEDPYTVYAFPASIPDDRCLERLAAVLNRIERGLVVLGSLEAVGEREPVHSLIRKLGWPALPDITSGLRLGTPDSPMVPHYDGLLASPAFADLNRPQAVLHLGGRLLSKRLLDYLEQARPHPYVLVDDHPQRHDPLHNVTDRVEAEIDRFCESLQGRLQPRKGSAWLGRWREASDRVSRAMEAMGESATLNEPVAARLVSRMLPAGHGVFLAASMPMRDMDTYAAADGARAAVGCNRGASGIDGVLATATGFARGLGRPVTLMIGDIALLHDLNSLNLLRSIDTPVTVIVLNNNGGGIFSFLPIARFPDVFERYFGTPHNLTFEGAARMFGVAYARPSTRDAFVEAYRSATRGNRSTIIEIASDRKENYDLHMGLVRTIVSSLKQD